MLPRTRDGLTCLFLPMRAVDVYKRQGHSIVFIEHNMDVIKCADYVIDLGPEGGDKGGNIVAVGTPEEVAACGASYTCLLYTSMIQRY